MATPKVGIETYNRGKIKKTASAGYKTETVKSNELTI